MSRFGTQDASRRSRYRPAREIPARRLPTYCLGGWQSSPSLHEAGLRLVRQISSDEFLLSLRVHSIIVDGEAVCGWKGRQVGFDKLHSRAHDQQVFLYAFDLLELNGEDYRQYSLEKRKAKLEKLLARTRQGMRFSEHLDGDGETIFQHACKMGLEGIVSKRRDFPYSDLPWPPPGSILRARPDFDVSISSISSGRDRAEARIRG